MVSKIKTAWYVKFSDREGCIAYTEAIAQSLVRGTLNGFQNGMVTEIDLVITEWWGDWERGTRGFRELQRSHVDFSTWY